MFVRSIFDLGDSTRDKLLKSPRGALKAVRDVFRQQFSYSTSDHFTPRVLTTTYAQCQGHEHALHILTPRSSRNALYEYEQYYNSHWFRCPELLEPFFHNELLSFKETVDPFKLFTDILREKHVREGYVTTNNDLVTVTLGIRRPKSFTEVDAALGHHTALVRSESWRGKTPKLSFYPDAIHPHLTKEDLDATSPITWISKRLAIALGYAFEFTGRDLPATTVEEPFVKVARIAGNLAPYSHHRARNYKLSEHSQTLLKCLDTNISNIPAELCAFVLEHAEVLSVKDLSSKHFERFNRHLNRYLSNGLNIDRLGEALVESLKAGYKVNETLPHILTIIDSTHGRSDKPWWFKEDFSIFGEKGLEGFTPNEAARMAEAAGHAYEYCREVFRIKGSVLANTEKFGRKSALRTCSFIGKRYGVGNINRAVRVLSYVEAILKEHAGTSPRKALKVFFELADRERPRSIALALYEGDKATLNIPGFFASFNTHLPEDSGSLPELSIPGLSAAPEHFPHLLKEFERPIAERAKLLPGVNIPIGRSLPAPLLLTYHGPEQKLLSLNVRNTSAPFSSTKPVSDFLAFNTQLSREVSHNDDPDHVASLYFAYCAPKLPNPLCPPRGLLSVIAKFSHLHTPGWEFPGLYAPSDRVEVTCENRDKTIRKYLLISQLLDTALLGMTSFDEVIATLEWIVGPLPQSEVRRIQTGQAWEKTENIIDYATRHASYLHSELIRHRTVVEKLQKALDKERAYGDESCKWDIDELKFAKDNVSRILQGKDPIENRFRRAEEEEDDDRFIKVLANPYPNEARPKRKRYNFDNTISEATTQAQINRMRLVISILHSASERRVLFERGLITEQNVTWPIAQELLAARATDRLSIGEELPALIPPSGPAEDLINQLDTLISHQLLNPTNIAANYNGDLASHHSLVQEISRAHRIVVRLTDRTVARHDEGRGGSKHLNFNSQDSLTLLSQLLQSPIVDLKNSRFYTEIFWPVRYGLAQTAITHLQSCEALQSLSVGMSSSLLSENDQQRAVTSATRSVVITAFAAEALSFLNANLTYDLPNTESPDKREGNQIDVFAALPTDWHIELTQKFSARIPGIINTIHKARRQKFLLGPIGGKIHVVHPISEPKLEEIKSKLGLSSTGFALIHAGHSLLLPPMPTPEELNYLISFLTAEGILDTKFPEIQYACSGRLPNNLCGILGSTILLGSNTGVRYNENSFSTNRNTETGMRIMVYDANGPRTTYPFVTSLPGRTDMLGRQDFSDAEIYQLVHSVLAHVATNGVLKEVGLKYIQRHISALQAHGLIGVMKESWVLDPHQLSDRDSTSHFRNAIVPCVDAWFAANEKARQTGQAEGIIRDVHNNLDWLKAEVKILQEEALISPKYALERKILLGCE